MLKRLPSLFLPLFLILVFQLFSQFGFADGSKDLFPSSGTGSRSSLMSASTGFYPSAYAFINSGVQKVFVNAGETIYMGSSAQGKGSGTILVFKPSTTGRTLADAVGNSGTGTNTANTPGVIYNRTQELLGPIASGTATTSTGYQPFKVVATETGVYEVDFIAPTGAAYNSASAPSGVFDNLVSNGWTSSDQSSSSPSIIAWDVTVANSGGTVIPGRVYMNVFNTYCSLSNISNAADGFFGKFYILTKDGFPYLVNNNGMNGIAFTFFANNRGFTTGANGTGTRTYKSLNYSTNPPVKNPNNADDPDSDPQQNITHKIFYAAPATDLPASATYMGTTTWLKVATPANPAAVNISFTGVEGSSGQASSKGGNITFTANIGGTYRITIPGGTSNGTTFYPRVLAGPSVSGSNTVFWDGKSGTQADPLIAAALLPPGSSVSSIKVQVFGAEIHFPFLDVEQNPNGIIIGQVDGNNSYAPLTNQDGSFKDVVYWDDSDITLTGNSNPSSGSNSGSGTLPSTRRVGLGTTGIASNRPNTVTPGYGHQWDEAGGTSGYGNERALDTYSFVSGVEQTTAVAITIKQADLEVTSISSSTSATLHVGDSWSYTAVIKNNGPDAVVTNTNSANGPITTGAKFQLYVPSGVTIDPTQVTMTSACATIQGTPTFSAGVFSAIVDMPTGCTASFVIPVTATSTVLTENTNVNTYATILRPADYTDPDATNTTSTAPTDPFFEAAGIGVAMSNAIYTNSASINTASTNNVKRNSNVKVSTVSSQTITFAALPAKTYGDADFNAGATASSGLAVTYASSNPAVATVDAAGLIHILTVGTTDITASQSGNGSYSAAAPVTQTLTVNKASQTINFATIPPKTYGGVDFAVNATASSGLAVTYASSNPAVATVSSSGAVHILASGTTDITASQSGNVSYNAATPVTQTLTVNKASLTVTADNQSKAYGSANPPLTVSYLGFVNGDTRTSLTTQATASTSATTSSAAGTYAITATGAVGNNYTFTYTAGTFTINQNSQTIAFSAIPAKTYGDPDFSLSATASSGLPVTYSISNPAIATVDAQGNVHILSAGTTDITASQTGNINYTAAAAVTQTLTVNKASLTVTANSQSKTYGAANPALTVTYSGFVPGETSASLTAQPTVSTTATSASPVGTYPITAAGAVSANYNFTYVNAALSVFPGVQTITFTALPKTYGDPDFTLSATASSGLPVTYSSSNPAIATVDANGTVHIVSAGVVIITAQQQGNGNYTATTNINQQLVINKAALTVIADNQTKTYGSGNPALTITYSGFVNGDTDANLTTQPTISTTATSASAVGTYPINIAGAASPNYNFTYVNGALAVGQSSQTLTFSSLTNKIYGDADFMLNATASSGLPVVYTSSDPTVATVDANGTVHILSAGTSVITATQPGNSSYLAAADVQQTLTVAKAALTVTADNQTKPYGSDDPALTVTYSGFVYGDTNASLATQPTIATTATATSAVGTYAIEVSGATSSNYNFTYVNGTLTVGQSSQTLSFSALSSKTYGDADFTLSVTASSGLPVVYTSSDPTIATVDANGTVHIVSAGIAVITATQPGNSSYTAAPFLSQTLTVNKAALTVTANNQNKTIGAASPALTLTYTGFVNGDTNANLTTQPTVATTATANAAAGNYPITVSGAVAVNYSFTYVPGTLTITNAAVSNVGLAQIPLFENRSSGTQAGTLSAASIDPNATYTYSLVSGTGSADNALFSISGNKLLTARSLDYEQKAIYQILVRATNQYGLYLDQTFTISLNDVNEAPTMAAIANQANCLTLDGQSVKLTGITPGPETAQTTTLSVSSNNPGLFSYLSVSAGSGGQATLNYNLAATGTAVVTVTVADNGGTANGGTDSFSQTFTITSNEVPAAAIASDKGTQISKGETVTLTATGGTIYSWDNAAGMMGSTNTAITQVRPSQTTTYQVKTSNASGCSSTSSITINVTDDYALVHPTNILTPNGDGKNDTWVVRNIDLYPDNTVSIFDKGGRLLQKISHYNNDWNGSYNGSPLAEDTYYYVIDFGSGKYVLKGFITILRNR